MNSNHSTSNFPFSAIVGQEDFKLALILNLIEPSIGGILAVGDKGTGKTTLIRSLAKLMSSDNPMPFVNLPIGVSEDRLLGNILLETLINEKREVIQPGLMAQADKGILYIDEINLLQDHLIDNLLDASSTGGYHLEREGLSHYIKSRFCLIGSMNPEEGNLRPQLKDRFGLSVNITTPTDTKLRQEIVKRRLQFDDNTEEFLERYEPQNQIIAKQIYNAKQNLCSIHFDDTLIAYCSDLAIRYQVEGLRADILLLKTSRAYAAYLGESEVTTEMVNKIAHFVFNHRGNQTPPESPNPETKEQQEQENDTSNNNENTPQENVNSLTPLNDFLRIKTNTESTTENFSYQQDAPQGSVHVTDTSKTVRQYVATDKFSIQTKRQKKQISQHHIFLIDSSGSMLKDRIIAYAKGAVHKIVTQAKNQLTQFSLISLFDGEAQHILTNTTTLEDVETALGNLKTGGKTNLIAGFKKVKNIATDIDSQHHLHIITDGKLNTESSLESTILGFQTYTKAVRSTRIIDAETGIVKVGIAQKLAKRIQANYELLMTKNEY